MCRLITVYRCRIVIGTAPPAGTTRRRSIGSPSGRHLPISRYLVELNESYYWTIGRKYCDSHYEPASGCQEVPQFGRGAKIEAIEGDLGHQAFRDGEPGCGAVRALGRDLLGGQQRHDGMRRGKPGQLEIGGVFQDVHRSQRHAAVDAVQGRGRAWLRARWECALGATENATSAVAAVPGPRPRQPGPPVPARRARRLAAGRWKHGPPAALPLSGRCT